MPAHERCVCAVFYSPFPIPCSLFPLRLPPADGLSDAGNRPGLVSVIVADQAAGVHRAVVGDGEGAIRSDDLEIKIHQAFAGNSPRLRAHAMRRMAHGAREPILDHMPGMLAKAAAIHDLGEIVAFGAQGVRSAICTTLGAQVGIGKQIRNEFACHGRLAELISSLQDMRKHRPMRAVGPGAAELTIVIAIVAVGAKYPRSHAATRSSAVQIQHVGTEAGLWEHAAAIVEHRVT